MKKALLSLFICLCCCAAASADVTKILHVIKARITVNNKSHVTYALIIGEFPHHSDSLLQAYKENPDKFTMLMNKVMQAYQQDTISLYSTIFTLKEHDLILLPEDKLTKIARSQVQKIAFMEYIPYWYTGGMIYTEINSSDSTWLSWKTGYSETFEDDTGMCRYTALYFNKPDRNSQDVVKLARDILIRQNNGTLTEQERIRFRKRLARLRVIIFGMCTC